jgi:hypothetical protein
LLMLCDAICEAMWANRDSLCGCDTALWWACDSEFHDGDMVQILRSFVMILEREEDIVETQMVTSGHIAICVLPGGNSPAAICGMMLLLST